MQKTLVLLTVVALLWLSACAGITPATDPAVRYGPCADWMPYYYCGK
ncbi:MAG: hypothetical protein ACM335_02155 [Deltaproteobacteria bacterium]